MGGGRARFALGGRGRSGTQRTNAVPSTVRRVMSQRDSRRAACHDATYCPHARPRAIQLDRQSENRATRKAAAAAKAEEMKKAAALALEETATQRAVTIESKRKANMAADAAAKEFFATESNPWAKIVEYCDMKPKAQAKDAPKAKDTTRLRGMLLDLKHNPIEAK